MWNPFFFVAFPPQVFGFLSGLTMLASMPLQFLNVPMYNYIAANGDFAVMNYIFVGLFIVFLSLPVVVYIILIKSPEKNKQRYIKKISTSEPSSTRL